MNVKHLIVGAGPTGLGAAHRLRELGEESFLVLERAGHPGGLSASFRDEAGYTWDVGGHVLFSHYGYFDRLVDDLLGGAFLTHQRESWVRVCGTWVPYPFQNNIRHLPPEARWDCVRGLLPGQRPEGPPADFRAWIECVFGRGIADHFLLPYNFKVWATPPELMSASWVGERVSVVDLEGVLKNLVLERDDVGWGPNNTFRFPLSGGTGAIFEALAGRVADRIRYRAPVVRVDARARTVTCADGQAVGYETLLNTGPLDLLAGQWLADPDPELVDAAGRLTRNGVHVTGVGTASPRPGDTRCWMYFPGPETPFYRCTNFHNYSPANVPGPAHRALMCETSFSGHKPENPASVPGRTLDGLCSAGLLHEAEAQRATIWETSVEYGYPVPCLGRDQALHRIQPRLEALGIFSRGRFGGWKYEVGNMDHSVMQGVEWAERMVSGTPEKTYTL